MHASTRTPLHVGDAHVGENARVGGCPRRGMPASVRACLECTHRGIPASEASCTCWGYVRREPRMHADAHVGGRPCWRVRMHALGGVPASEGARVGGAGCTRRWAVFGVLAIHASTRVLGRVLDATRAFSSGS